MIGYVYKLQHKDKTGEFYIGSTTDFNSRKKWHEINSKTYATKLYIYMRSNGGFSNWVFDILIEKEIENFKELTKLEQIYFDNLFPSLNARRAAKRTKITCHCGGKYNFKHRYRHFITKKHSRFKMLLTDKFVVKSD